MKFPLKIPIIIAPIAAASIIYQQEVSILLTYLWLDSETATEPLYDYF